MADIDWSATEQTLKDAAAQRGIAYDPSDLADVQRNASYAQNSGVDPSKYLDVAISKYDARANNQPNEAPGTTWATAQSKTGPGPAQTGFTVGAGGTLTKTPNAPNFALPTIGSTSTSPSPTPPYSAATQKRITAAQAAGLSPIEAAQQGGYSDQLTQYTNWLYADPTRVGKATQAGVNLYDPDTWSLFGPNGTSTPTTTSPSTPTTPSVTGAPTGTHPTSTTPPGTTFQNTAPTFDDPASRLVEDYGLSRAQQLTNPDPNSATAQYESYAKNLIGQLSGPAYSDQDQAILKTKAIDSIMQQRDQTKQQWLQELSARGIPPSSGVALDGMLQIDNHFEGLRTAAEAQFASQAIQQTQQNRLTGLNTSAQLAAEQEGRLTNAGQFVQIPLDLQNQAFSRNLQLLGASGSPSDLLNSALGLASFGQNSALLNSQNNQAMTAALLQYLGYLYGG